MHTAHMFRTVKAKNILQKIGVDPALKGFYYIIDAIREINSELNKNNIHYRTTDIYKTVAELNNSNESRVERNIRQAIEKTHALNNTAYKNLFKPFIEHGEKPNNSTFLSVITHYLIDVEE